MRVLVGLARVDDDRALQLAREPDLRAKHRLLHVARREVVVVVEADLADGARRRRRGELLPDDGGGPLGVAGELVRLVRVDADRRTAPRARARRRARPARPPSRCPPSRITSARSTPASLARATTCVEIGGERLVGEMAVAVDHRDLGFGIRDSC